MSPKYTFTQEGKRTVILRAWSPFDCMTEEQVEIQVGGVGVFDLAVEHGMKVYPVPTHSVLHIEFENAELNKNVAIDLVDINGRLVYSNSYKVLSEKVSIDIRKLALKPGMYWLRVKGSAMTHTRQIAVR